MSVFVSGTGTDVGKTLFCSLVMAKYAKSLGLKYFKPIQTGSDSDRVKVMNLTGLNESHFLKNYYTFELPASPHLASEMENLTVDTGELSRHLFSIKGEKILVEGAGGVYVPLNRYFFTMDLVEQSKLPLVLVASTELGTINHTLLSIEAIRKRDIRLLGVYFIGPENPLRSDNIRTIIEAAEIGLLGTFLLEERKLSRQEFLDKVVEEFDPDRILPDILFP
ncbi:dethiobiotin synthase [Leptospira langatensis]|uniref:ATP-dependent dethiobiotin synthetase BioD n=1 Tax=Leptospira langatensis TaxID=2484983 RepID=A0A5F1ZZY4_9LEPT|nr:dethiobiotin synthase [Leptospira langatensis]TGK04097.1 dethiobiotin synthase [Leptospira langatensis]TGL43577.1 dethiobiotin synthase [Leptospira langatensis]